MRESREELEAMIEATLAERFPGVELVDLEVRGGPMGTLTLFVDLPGGVDLGLCAAISQSLDVVRERYALEVSSPGLDRRLRKPAHFAAALGLDVAVKSLAPRAGRSNFRGVLKASDATSITLLLADGGSVTLPLDGIAKAHVVYNFATDGGHRE
ncbi:MAG: ribosome maturation factor RimP [Actinobacteria bacterium]|nr:ribosome maturation factor RimP [Actinomycetota bacterium]